MKRLTLLLFISVLLFQGCAEPKQTEIEVISAEEMNEITNIESVQLVDVRTQEEFKSGHINNAQNIDYYADDFEMQIAKLDKTKPVLVYCNKGGRSAKCASKMKEAGFVKVYDLEGGIAKWKYKGFEIKTIQ